MSQPNYPARFISFEGTEGVGKTTAIKALAAKFDALGIDYIQTREPGGSPFAEKLRALLLDPATQINDDTELLLMFAARSDHLQSVILPALNQNQWVICDRFVDSTTAYQGFGRGFGDKKILDKIAQLTENFVPKLPDLTLWLDLPVDLGMARADKRSKADRFEQERQDFFNRVYEGFATLANHEPRFCRIDAQGESDEVALKIWQAVQSRLFANSN
ncbi:MULTISPECIES: dTMP kinase [Psychrobacter]|uniref:dTMP kinase n=1 Tax=Psychrobacter TaxID=497 RepID=UPI00146CED0B|nr:MULTISPECIES: dTMP kinase [Psychrobacter]